MSFAYGSAFASTAYEMCIGNFDTSTWSPMYELSVPFDVGSIERWLSTWFILCTAFMSYISCTTSIVTYFMSCCHYIGASCDHLKHLMRSNQTWITENQQADIPLSVLRKNNCRVKNQTHKSIEIHTELYV